MEYAALHTNLLIRLRIQYDETRDGGVLAALRAFPAPPPRENVPPPIWFEIMNRWLQYALANGFQYFR